MRYFFGLLFILYFILFNIQAQTPIRVVCVGNSITEGFGLTTPSTEAYPVQLAKLLGNNYSVLNCGVSARTMLKHGDVPYWKESKYTQAKNHNPNIVIITLGTNDSKPQNWVYKNEFYADYAAMIGEFRSNGKNPQIFVCIPPPAFIDNFGIRDSIIRDEMKPIIDSLCTNLGTSKIDFFHKMLHTGSYFGDGIHPNKDGASIMAQIAFEAISKPIAIKSVKSPISGFSLTNNEQIIVSINNNAAAITNVPIAYKINNGAEVKEVINSLPAKTEFIYKFSQKADLSAFKEYSISVYTAIGSGQKNDTVQVQRIHAKPRSDLALMFSGDNNKVRIPHSSSLMPTTAMTIEAWVYPTAFKKDNYAGTILSKEQSGSSKGYALSVGGNGEGRFMIYDGAVRQALAPAGSLTLNQWQHIAGVYNGSSIKIYVDGLLKSNIASDIMQESNSEFVIGQTSYPNRDRTFLGGIDEVRVWNKALTQAQIQDQKGVQLWGNEQGLTGYYNMNDGFNSLVASDGTATGKTGKIENFEATNSWMTGVGLPFKSGASPVDVSLASINKLKTGKGLTNENITIEVFNLSNVELFNIPVTYQVDNGVVVTETIARIDAQSGIEYTFTQKANLSEFKIFTITASTLLNTDLIPQNNLKSKTITNFDPKSDNLALTISGSDNGRLSIPHDSNLMPLTAFTIEAWIYPTQFKTSIWEGTVLSKESSGGGYALNIGGNGQGRIVIGGSNWFEAVLPANSIALNTWSHVAGVYDGSTIKIYVNGILKATKTNVGAINASNSELHIGASPAFSNREFIGGIDEVRIWNRALSDTEVKTFKDYKLKGTENGLVAYYKMNEQLGSTIVTDSTGHGYNGTIKNLDLTNCWIKGVELKTYLDPTDIQVLKNPLGLFVYPNPTNDFITLRLSTKNKYFDLIATDMVGKVFLKRRIMDTGHGIKIDMSSLNKGIYLLKCSSTSESSTIKVTVK